jgi:hypothetical protein
MNDDDYRELFIPLVDYLKEIGCDKQKHSGNRSLLHHLVGVSMILSEGNCSDALCVAGLFHSIYGTVVFRPKMVPMDDRDKIKDLIGIESENLVYQFCILPKDRRAGIYALEDGYVKKDLYDLTYANNEEQRLWREINNDTGL